MKGESLVHGQTWLTIVIGCQHRATKVGGKLGWHHL